MVTGFFVALVSELLVQQNTLKMHENAAFVALVVALENPHQTRLQSGEG